MKQEGEKKEIAPEGSIQEQYIDYLIEAKLKPFKIKFRLILFILLILIFMSSFLIFQKSIIINDLQKQLEQLKELLNRF